MFEFRFRSVNINQNSRNNNAVKTIVTLYIYENLTIMHLYMKLVQGESEKLMPIPWVCSVVLFLILSCF